LRGTKGRRLARALPTRPKGKAAKKDWWGTAKDRFACACEGMVEVDVEIFRAEEITKEVILPVARKNSTSCAAAERT
jgi:hypothetical protein